MLRPSPHPAKGLLFQRGISQKRVARQLGKSTRWVYLCLNGLVPVPRDFQVAVAALLGLPVESCFAQGPESDEDLVAGAAQ